MAAAALRGIGAKLSANPEKVTSALLLGSFVALAFRSSEQQGEIDELEARKSSLRAANSAMSSTMWAWREELVKLAAMPSPPITAARLRHIYGEEDLAVPADDDVLRRALEVRRAVDTEALVAARSGSSLLSRDTCCRSDIPILSAVATDLSFLKTKQKNLQIYHCIYGG